MDFSFPCLAKFFCPPEPKWLEIAREEIGVLENSGDEHNERILEYHSTTLLKSSEDEVPWCSSFVCWVMQEAGYTTTQSAAARSWLGWGEGLMAPKAGAVTVLWREDPKSWKGHVGFYVAHDDRSIFLLGGNQNDRVCIKGYPIGNVLGYFWPRKEDYLGKRSIA